MAWIDEIPEQAAAGALKAIYEDLSREAGGVDASSRAQSLNPEALRSHAALTARLMFGESGLSRGEREAIAVVVSATNNSPYCVEQHGEQLAGYENDNAHLQKILSGFRFLNLPDRAARMLAFAAKLTARPARIVEKDLDGLREAGFSDRDILDITLVAGYVNFTNRLNLALGVGQDHVRDDHSGRRASGS